MFKYECNCQDTPPAASTAPVEFTNVYNASTADPDAIFRFSGGVLPVIGSGFQVAELELDLSAGDINLTNWSHGADEGTWIRVRKTDSTSNALIFTDGVQEYSFARTTGEFILFQVINGALSIR